MKLNHSLIKNKKKILHEYLDLLEKFYQKKITILENEKPPLLDYENEMIREYKNLTNYRHDQFKEWIISKNNLCEYAKSFRKAIEEFLEEKNKFIIVILAWYDADIALINIHRSTEYSGEQVYTRDNVSMGIREYFIDILENMKKLYPLKKYFNNGEFYFDNELGVTYTCKPLHSIYWGKLAVGLDWGNFIAANLMPS